MGSTVRPKSATERQTHRQTTVLLIRVYTEKVLGLLGAHGFIHLNLFCAYTAFQLRVMLL